jgi:cytochrome c oxidase subunit 2
MAITPPESRIWWNQKVERGELVWIVIAFLWGIVMFFMMVYWHLYGQQNLSGEVYRIDPEIYAARTEEFAEKNKIEEVEGIPVAKAAPGADIYMLARTFEWWPILELQKGQSYRLHLSALDVQHGFSLQPVGINIQIHPGIEHIVTLTPTQAGQFGVVCNEYCGLGHHQMTGRIRVVE